MAVWPTRGQKAPNFWDDDLRGYIDSAAAEASASLPAHVLADDDNEPRGVVCWTFDDGYSAAVDYFGLMDTRSIKGTLFLTQNWIDREGTNASWDDTYITTAQVQAIVTAGHEIATHGLNHESAVNYRDANGDAALAALYDGVADYIETTFGVTVTTGAYPGGASDRRTREIMGRRHDFFRGAKGIVATDAWNPYDVPAVDVQSLTESAINTHIDTANANGGVAVFLIHGEPAGATRDTLMTKLGNCMDYAAGLGMQQVSFGEAMADRNMRRSPGAMDDTSGNAFRRRIRAHRVTLSRSDGVAADVWFEIDPVSNTAYTDGNNGKQFEFRGQGLLVTGTKLDAGRQQKYSGTTTTDSSDVSIPLLSVDDSVIGVTIAGTGIPADTFVGSHGVATVGMVDSVGAPVNATASGTVTITLGFPDAPFSNFYRRADFHGGNPRRIGDSSADGYVIADLAGAQTLIMTARKLERATAAPYLINTAGGDLNLRAGRTKNQDASGNAFLSFNSAAPTDGSIANGETVIYPDPATGSLLYKGKDASGVVFGPKTITAA